MCGFVIPLKGEQLGGFSPHPLLFFINPHWTTSGAKLQYDNKKLSGDKITAVQ